MSDCAATSAAGAASGRRGMSAGTADPAVHLARSASHPLPALARRRGGLPGVRRCRPGSRRDGRRPPRTGHAGRRRGGRAARRPVHAGFGPGRLHRRRALPALRPPDRPRRRVPHRRRRARRASCWPRSSTTRCCCSSPCSSTAPAPPRTSRPGTPAPTSPRPTARATAVSIAMVSTTLGAVAGPNSVEVLGELATSLGIPALAGPFLLAAVAYAPRRRRAVRVPATRPVPRRPSPSPATTRTRASRAGPGGRRAAEHAQAEMSDRAWRRGRCDRHGADPDRDGRDHDDDPGAHAAPRPQSRSRSGSSSASTSAPCSCPRWSPVSLVDRVGRLPMAIAAGTTLLAAGLVAALAPGDSLPLLTLALGLLGLGWNFGLISGTALIVDSTPLRDSCPDPGRGRRPGRPLRRLRCGDVRGRRRRLQLRHALARGRVPLPAPHPRGAVVPAARIAGVLAA